MKLSSVLILILSMTTVGLTACAPSGGGGSGVAPSIPNTLVYKVSSMNGATLEVEDVAYVDYDKSRVVIADFDVCFKVIDVSPLDISEIKSYVSNASSAQASAQAACAASTDAYSVTSSRTNATYAVCGTQLQAKIEEIMARPGNRLCKPLSEI